MTDRPESNSPYINRLATHVGRHVERRLDRGEVVFAARPVLASLAIGLMTGEKYAEARQATADAAIAALEASKAEGELFAIRQDLGNGLEDSRDKIHVTRRDGAETNALYGTEDNPGLEPIIRARTSANI